jgi:endonuclease/exonuclease/phosphatase family metal-dependent hydrolase
MWIIWAIVVVCLLAFVIMTDFQMGPVKREPYMGEGVPIVSNGVIIDKLKFNSEFSQKNKNSAIVDFYTQQIQRTEDQSKTSAILDSHTDNIATLNVHMFEPINMNYTRYECMEATLQLMKRFNVSVLTLQEVPVDYLDEFQDLLERKNIYHTIDDFDEGFIGTKEPITNVVISKYPVIKEKKVLLSTEPTHIFKHRHAIFFRVPAHPHHGQKLFCTTHLEVDIFTTLDNSGQKYQKSNEVIRKLQLRDIFTFNTSGPDIIMGDLNLEPESPEYAKLLTKYKIDSKVEYTVPKFDENQIPTSDYIWYKKNDEKATWSIQTYDVNYLWSDHRPVIGIQKN